MVILECFLPELLFLSFLMSLGPLIMFSWKKRWIKYFVTLTVGLCLTFAFWVASDDPFVGQREYIGFAAYLFLLIYIPGALAIIYLSEKKMQKTKGKTIRVILVIGLIIGVDMGVYYALYKDASYEYEIHYEVTIYSNNTNFTVQVPILLQDNRPSEHMDELKMTSGSGNYSIVTTQYGYALQVQGMSEVHISAIKKAVVTPDDPIVDDIYFTGGLSMKKERVYGVYWFNSTSNVTMEFIVYSLSNMRTDVGTPHYFNKNFQLEPRWQEIKLVP